MIKKPIRKKSNLYISPGEKIGEINEPEFGIAPVIRKKRRKQIGLANKALGKTIGVRRRRRRKVKLRSKNV